MNLFQEPHLKACSLAWGRASGRPQRSCGALGCQEPRGYLCSWVLWAGSAVGLQETLHHTPQPLSLAASTAAASPPRPPHLQLPSEYGLFVLLSQVKLRFKNYIFLFRLPSQYYLYLNFLNINTSRTFLTYRMWIVTVPLYKVDVRFKYV